MVEFAHSKKTLLPKQRLRSLTLPTCATSPLLAPTSVPASAPTTAGKRAKRVFFASTSHRCCSSFSGGCGCLVPSGSCNSASCAFPRVCLCAKVGGQTQNGADCSPVDSGPCTVCIAKSTNVVKATPVKALYTEFSRISDAQIDERMRSVNLETSGSFNNKVQRLAEHVHMLESKK